MPQIRVKPNQMIELILQFEKEYEVYCDSITDGVVLVLFDATQRRLVVAHALPELKAVGSFLFTVGAFAESNEKVQCHLIGGPKSDEQLYGAFYGKLKEIGFQFKTAENNFENALITIDDRAELHAKNIPSKEDQPDFPDFTDRKDDITDLLTEYQVIGAGEESRQRTKISMLATFSTRVEDEDYIEPESPSSDGSVFDPKRKAAVADVDALLLELDQSTAEPISSSKKVLISQASAIATALPIYVVDPWQIAVVSLSTGRKVKLNRGGGNIGLVVCDTISGVLVVCLIGKGTNMQPTIDRVTQKCLVLIKTRASQMSKSQLNKPVATATSHSIVFSVVAGDGLELLKTAVKAKTESAAKALKMDVHEFKEQVSQQSQFCFLEWEAGVLRITPEGNDLGPAYRTSTLATDEGRFAQVRQMERSNAEWILYKDYISVKDIPIIVELEDSCFFDFDMKRKKPLLRLQEKTILLVAYCSHLSRAVFFQVKTDEFKKYILGEKLKEGHFMMLNAMTNFPRDDNAPPIKLYVFCREKKTGHANDATACMDYVKDFSKTYTEFAAGATDIYMKRAGTKYQLHRMSEHVNVHFYSEKEISSYYLFEPSGSTLSFTLTSMAEQEKGEFVVVKKGKTLSKYEYKELGIKAVDNYKNSSYVADRKSGKPN